MRPLLLLALGLVLALVRPVTAATGGPDSFGYTWNDDPQIPPLTTSGFQWIDITTTGQLVINSGNNVSSNHPVLGIGGPVTLGRPFTFYGVTYTQLVPAVDGYLSTDPAEAGADSTNDCPLPKLPSNGSGARIYGYHDDLLIGAGSGVYYQYIPVGAHPLNRTGVSVFTWENVERVANPGLAFDFQVLLFDDGDILHQFRAGALNLGSSATIGLQNADASVALSWSCDTAGIITGNDAIFFTTPVISVTTNQDQNDTPRGAQTSLREAIRDIPIGGKISFGGAGGFQQYTATLAINKSLSISTESLISPLLDGINFTIASGAYVTINNIHFRNQPGNGFAVSNSARLKFCNSRVDSALGRTLLISGGGHADLYRTAVLLAGTGSGNMIEMNGGTLVVSESLLAYGYGHAVTFTNVAPTSEPQISILRSSVIHHQGEGIRGVGSRVLVRDSTISANEGGAGLNLAESCLLTLERSAVAQNRAGLLLGGSSSASITRSIIAGNSDPYTMVVADVTAGSGAITSGGYNLLGTSHASFVAGGDTVAADAKLSSVSPKNFRIGTRSIAEFLHAHTLLDGSPAIDGGGLTSIAVADNVDIRGQARIQDGGAPGIAIIDIGPLEMGPQVRVTTAVDENNGVGAGAGVSLREALLAHPNPHVVFSPALNGQTIVPAIFVGGAYFVCSADGVVDASSLASGITLDGQNATSTGMLAGGEWNRVSVRRANKLAIRSSGLLVLSDATFENNTNDVVSVNPNNYHGGAVFSSGYTHMTRCRFLSNRADNASGAFPGGAISCREYTWEGTLVTPPSLYLLGCHFEKNSCANTGGAIHATDSVAVTYIDRCHFTGNMAESHGGAAYLSASAGEPAMGLRRIRRSSFVDNLSLENGGALYLVGHTGSLTHRSEITHSTFHGNYANDSGVALGLGGAIYSSTPTLVVDHVTFTENGAVSGGAIWSNGQVRLSNSAFGGNFFYAGVGGAGPVFLAGAGGTIISMGYNICDSVQSAFSHTLDLPAQPLLLEPPHDHGDGTASRHPLPGSPLLDAGSAFTASTDQRGLPGMVGARTDIGAIEATPLITVTTAIDQNNTPAGAQISLREAIRDALPGQRIQFNLAAMGTNVINLATGMNTQLTVDKSLRLEGGNTPNGITLAGPSGARVMNISSATARVFIDGLSMRDGNAGLSGGAIRNNGALLRLSRSALYQNNAGSGGALLALNGETYLENVTIAENTTATGGVGSAILAQNSAIVYLDHCTVADNTCTNGGAIDLDHTATVSINHSAFSINLVTSILQSRNFFADGTTATVISRGRNRLDSTLAPWADPTDTLGFSDLEALTDYGGLARVCRPTAISFLRDAAPIPQFVPATDARGFLRIYGSGLDIGAAELVAGDLGVGADTDSDGMPDSWETGYSLNPSSPADAGLDADGDGQSNLLEYHAGTNPRDSTSVFRILSINVTSDRSRLDYTWSSVPGLNYTVWHSTNLVGWTQIDSGSAGTGQTVMARAITNPTLLPSGKVFLQVRLNSP